MNGHSGAVTSITFSHDDKWIATGSIDGTARIWCATTGAELRILPQPRIVYSVAFSPDDMILATSSDSKQSIQLWDSKTGDDLEEPSFGRTILAYSADFSNDGGLIVGSTQHSTLAWNAQTGEQIHSLDGHKSWTCLPSGVSYTVLHNSWICKANDLASTPPAKLFWIPPKYRPLEDKQVRRPVAFFSASGDRIVLANGHDTVVISLPVV
jgi:WD40 repeat protein